MQFVHEQPDREGQRKKRLRVVTACDSCRTRKVKCVVSNAGKKCVACEENGYECRYHDKERYYAEKRPSSSGRSGSTRRQSPRVSLSSQHDQSSRSTLEQSASLSLQPIESMYNHTDSDLPNGSTSYYHANELPSTPTNGSFPTYYYQQNGYELAASGMTVACSPPGSLSPEGHSPAHSSGSSSGGSPPMLYQSLIPLFDDTIPGLPHDAIFSIALEVFFKRFSHSYLFLDYAELSHKYRAGTLSPALACTIAAAALPFCAGFPELTGHNIGEVTAIYMETAKNFLSGLIQSSISLSGLHAIILVACLSYQDQAQYALYANLALQVAHRFGINTPTGQVELAQGNPIQLDRIQATWVGIASLLHSP